MSGLTWADGQFFLESRSALLTALIILSLTKCFSTGAGWYTSRANLPKSWGYTAHNQYRENYFNQYSYQLCIYVYDRNLRVVFCLENCKFLSWTLHRGSSVMAFSAEWWLSCFGQKYQPMIQQNRMTVKNVILYWKYKVEQYCHLYDDARMLGILKCNSSFLISCTVLQTCY